MIGKYVDAIIAGVSILVLGGLIWWAHHSGYSSGQAEREAYYEPLISAAREAKAAADLKASDTEADELRLKAQMESDYVAYAKDLESREADAARRIADLLRRAKSGAACRGEVPAPGGSAGVPDGASAGDERIERVAGSIAATGGRCEHDASQVTDWQRYYEKQRALINGTR